MSNDQVHLEYIGDGPRHFRTVGGVNSGDVVSVAASDSAALLGTGYFKKTKAPKVMEDAQAAPTVEEKGR